MSRQKRWKTLVGQRTDLEKQIQEINENLSIIQSRCSHPNLPERGPGEEYMDTCPDCGYAQYCYLIG